VFGPNASGKSNLLDALRFLRDLTLDGGGLQKAVHDRGDVKRLRNLAARNFNSSQVTVSIALGADGLSPTWQYELSFTAERRGNRRPIVVREIVRHLGKEVLRRPDPKDEQDPERLTQTAIEQVGENRDFRGVKEFLASVCYLHLVPQVIRDPDRGADLTEDPFGGDFLARVARTPERDRQRRMRVINLALQLAVPQLEQLALGWDDDKRPHLEARYNHWRVTKALQNESDFSDGTLRLIGLLWTLQERGTNTGPILLEEPELSLHEEVVRQLPTMMLRATKSTGRQVLATTHASDLLRDEALGVDEVLVLTPSDEGTTATLARDLPEVQRLLDNGYNLQEALNKALKPDSIGQLSFLKFA
jgi:predicted ATPase